jgi:hypothetical protein
VGTIISVADLAVEHDRADSLQHRLRDASRVDSVVALRYTSLDVSDVS